MSGGSGFATHATNVLKGNRALLKKRNFKTLKEILYEASGKTEVEFKNISAEELKRIKNQIRREAKEAARVELLIYIGCTLFTLILFYWIFFA